MIIWGVFCSRASATNFANCNNNGNSNYNNASNANALRGFLTPILCVGFIESDMGQAGKENTSIPLWVNLYIHVFSYDWKHWKGYIF